MIKFKLLGKRTIHTDLVDLPAILYLGVSARCYNMDPIRNIAMYLDASASGWTFNPSVYLGTIPPGRNARFDIADFGQRSKPAAATTSVITFTLSGYDGSGLIYSDVKNVTVNFIKSDDGSWTEDFKNDFDTGTVEGWAQRKGDTLIASLDRSLSGLFSLRGYVSCSFVYTYFRIEVYKTFAVPAGNEAYAIADLYVPGGASSFRALSMKNVALGWITGQYPVDQDMGMGPPINRWIRLVSPVIPNLTQEIAIIPEWFNAGSYGPGYVYLDDFRIVRK